MKSPEAVRAALATRYRRQEWRWLRAALGHDDTASDWPLRLSLGAPDERRALADPDALRAWLAAWRAHDGPGTLAHAMRRWQTLGRQTLPTHLILDDAATLADAVGQGARWRRLLHRGRTLARGTPERLEAIGTVLPTLAELDDADWTRWRAAADWLAAHPDSGLYPRQLPIAGIDTKTLERWRASLERWLVGGARQGTATGTISDRVAGTRDALGLRRLPVRLRTLALDSAVPGWPQGLTDIELPVTELAALPLRPARVLVVENLQSGLALPPLPGTLAVVGLGYALEPLAEIGWLADAPIDYWGDIDTHGLAMLARLRQRFGHVRSRLMDETTLLDHRALWVEETRPHAAISLDGLDEAEAALYDDLRRGTLGDRRQARAGAHRVAARAGGAGDSPPARSEVGRRKAATSCGRQGVHHSEPTPCTAPMDTDTWATRVRFEVRSRREYFDLLPCLREYRRFGADRPS